MNIARKHSLSLLGLAALSVLMGCSSLPADNARLEEARRDYRAAQQNPKVGERAGVEMRQASDALNKASDAWTRKDKPSEVDHWSYLAKQRIAIAQETAGQKGAEQALGLATAERDRSRLAARTNEADNAQRNANAAMQQADAAQRQAAMAQQQTRDARAVNAQLEAQLKEMNALQTERGLVITIGDVLFDTNRAELKPGGMRNVEKLVGFLKQYPQRTAMVEGYTDSVGSDSTNQGLSARRADAVRMALVDQGVGRERIRSQGYGEAYPVASNDSADGRQLNRRVEILLSDEAGAIKPR
ncbi:OmpA family protein [Paucibacter sp. O1-1]|nr:OmpA family protein [Paucibacter sp. O1-1]MDA3827596.1 OmpA family protein [Paucibacter sp. O1-1]